MVEEKRTESGSSGYVKNAVMLPGKTQVKAFMLRIQGSERGRPMGAMECRPISGDDSRPALQILMKLFGAVREQGAGRVLSFSLEKAF
jgi:hypothetical protein